jgi:hypothetical protein
MSILLDITLNQKCRQGGTMLNQATQLLLASSNPPFNVFITGGNEDKPANLSLPGNTSGACTM